MRRGISDPDLRRRLTPDYAIGCKRILLSSDWYPAITSPNVELVTSGIREVRERSIVDGDGVEHELDTIVFATGFVPSDPPIARRLRGREGRTLSETWQGSPQAYLGTTVAGFPNLFLFYGPNTNLGHSSIVYILESQMTYVLSALEAMDERGAACVEVRPQVQDVFNEEMQERLQGSVWNSGCSSWYLDRHGRNSIQWPGFTFEFRRRTRRFEPAEYRLSPPVPAEPLAAALGLEAELADAPLVPAEVVGELVAERSLDLGAKQVRVPAEVALERVLVEDDAVGVVVAGDGVAEVVAVGAVLGAEMRDDHGRGVEQLLELGRQVVDGVGDEDVELVCAGAQAGLAGELLAALDEALELGVGHGVAAAEGDEGPGGEQARARGGADDDRHLLGARQRGRVEEQQQEADGEERGEARLDGSAEGVEHAL